MYQANACTQVFAHIRARNDHQSNDTRNETRDCAMCECVNLCAIWILLIISVFNSVHYGCETSSLKSTTTTNKRHFHCEFEKNPTFWIVSASLATQSAKNILSLFFVILVLCPLSLSIPHTHTYAHAFVYTHSSTTYNITCHSRISYTYTR